MTIRPMRKSSTTSLQKPTGKSKRSTKKPSSEKAPASDHTDKDITTGFRIQITAIQTTEKKFQLSLNCDQIVALLQSVGICPLDPEQVTIYAQTDEDDGRLCELNLYWHIPGQTETHPLTIQIPDHNATSSPSE